MCRSTGKAMGHRLRVGLIALLLAGGGAGCGEDEEPPIGAEPPPEGNPDGGAATPTPTPAPTPNPAACGPAMLGEAGLRGPTALASGLDPNEGLWAGDLDGDGRPDLVGSGYSADVNQVVGLRNGGAGAMVAQDLTPGFLLLPPIDLDGDGDPDLVANDRRVPSRVRTLLNDGRGHFQPMPELRELSEGPFTAGDLDGDGLPELLSGEPEPPNSFGARSFLVYRNLGGGRLSAGERTLLKPATGGVPQIGATSLAVIDLDGNGARDLLWTDGEGVQVAHNLGGGRFELGRRWTDGLGVGALLASRDADGDGDLDLFVESGLLLNQGAFALRRSSELALQTLAQGLWVRTVADVDGDGDPDLLARESEWAMRLLRNLGGGRFRAEALSLPAGYLGEALAVADFDGDGQPDIAEVGVPSAGWGDPPLQIFWGQGAGRFPFGGLSVGDRPEYTIAVDLDRDGDKDLITANSRSISPLRNQGDGTFARAGDIVLGLLTHPEGLATGDFNGDGKIDLAVADELLRLRVLLGRGNLAFDLQPPPPEGALERWFESIAAVDLDGDKDLDLVAADGSQNRTLSTYLNDGDATFTAGPSLTVGADPSTVLALDLDRDGRLDLVSANEGDATVSVLLATGPLAFAPAQHHAVGRLPDAMAAGDLDGDGDADLVTANAFADGERKLGENSVSILRNDGTGGFGPRTDVPVGKVPRGVALGDIDGDGDADLVTANWQSNDASVLVNDGTGQLKLQLTLPVGPRPQGALLADLDARCGLDLAITSKLASEIRIFRPAPP